MYLSFMQSAFLFLRILELIIVIYIILTIIPPPKIIRNNLEIMISPILSPVQFMMEHSILKNTMVDFSPYIVFLIVSYLQSWFS